MADKDTCGDVDEGGLFIEWALLIVQNMVTDQCYILSTTTNTLQKHIHFGHPPPRIQTGTFPAVTGKLEIKGQG